MSLKRLLYSLFLYLIFPMVLLRLGWRSRLNPAYRKRIPERLGFFELDDKRPVICLHAVSVGETIAAKPLIEALIERYPDHRILITTTTPTGSDRVKSLFSQRVAHVYLPYDLLDAVSRFIRRSRPEILIIIETEIWPNLYAKCRQQSIPLVIVNARLSDKSTHAYLKIARLVAETLENVSIIAVRSAADAQRFKQLGASDKQIKIIGNIKYDIDVNQQQIKQGKQWQQDWRKAQKNRPVWVAASTHAGEDEIILAIYQHLLIQFSGLILVLVPRHPERFDAVYKHCIESQQAGIKTLRHSQCETYKDKAVNIIVGDTMGEMQSWYASADVVFMGGSLVKMGGHNPLEATLLGIPVLCGQYMFNFEDIAAELSAAELLFVCQDQNQVETKITSLLESDNSADYIKDYQAKAQAFMQQHRGITARLMQLVSKLL